MRSTAPLLACSIVCGALPSIAAAEPLTPVRFQQILATAKAYAADRTLVFYCIRDEPGMPTFNYLVLTNDHTQTLSAGARTPRAMVADNDEFLGKVVDTISHSPIWKESAIFVIEDDSQDGADHVDAHRIPAFVISPYAKQGAVVHTRYDFLSVIRSMELIMGMKPLGLFDEVATPMYDAFLNEPSNDAPFDAIGAKIDLLETNPSGTAGARAAAELPKCLDCIRQRDLDALLWKSVHGLDAVPPPPGPNAVGEVEREEEGEAIEERLLEAGQRAKDPDG